MDVCNATCSLKANVERRRITPSPNSLTLRDAASSSLNFSQKQYLPPKMAVNLTDEDTRLCLLGGSDSDGCDGSDEKSVGTSLLSDHGSIRRGVSPRIELVQP